MNQATKVLLRNIKIVLKGVLLFTLCSSYFLYLDLMFYAGTLGDAKFGCYGSPTAALEAEEVAMIWIRPILVSVTLLLLLFNRANVVSRILTIFFTIPTLTIFLLIQGMHFVGKGVSFAF